MRYRVTFDDSDPVDVEASTFAVEDGCLMFYRVNDVHRMTVAAFRYWISVDIVDKEGD